MKFRLLVMGKTHLDYLQSGIRLYEKRIHRYIKFEIETVQDVKNAGKINQEDLKEAEGVLLLKRIKDTESLILLDEKGTTYDSKAFSEFLENLLVHGRKDAVFCIGGAFGFSDKLYHRANFQMSLSKMTFSHQLVRLLFLEQLYRGFTIMKGEPYHHG